jgi:hypothetical protein
MAKAILRPRKRAKQRRFAPSAQAETEVEVAQILLRRAQDILSALAFCADQEAELSLGPVAVTARDLIARVLDGLATLVPSRSSHRDD